MELKYKVGDRVLATDNIEFYTEPSPGTVIETKEWGCNYLVRYDASDAVLWSNVHSLIKPKYPVIVISTDGKTTTAVKRIGKEILAKDTSVCHDDDEFDYDIGAAVAFARLVGADHIATGAAAIALKHETRKVVCAVTTGEMAQKYYTRGKIYTVTNISGDVWRITPDHGALDHFTVLKDYGSFIITWDSVRSVAEFIPLVED
jgi:hypothetical protein